MGKVFGFRFETVKPPHHLLVIGDFKAKVWQWSTAAHEKALRDAGLANIRWHSLRLPEERKDLAPLVQWYLDNPSCTVVSAEKTDNH